jgi:soluble lytic murein transglycosylase-like protein
VLLSLPFRLDRKPALAALVGLALAASAQAQLPPPVLPTLDGLPRPNTPPPEKGPVVPARVERWRQEAKGYEYGEGVPRDPVRAAELYCRAARHGDAEAQYSLAWMMTNSRGIERNEAEAAHLFAAAAEQGYEQARNILSRMGEPRGAPPPCLRPPEEDRVEVAAAPAPPAGRKAEPPAVLPVPPPARAPEPIVRFVNLVAPEYKLQPHLVLSIIATESNFDASAVSPKDAHGLMQLIPATAARFGVRNIKDPVQNIRGGMAYLRWLMARFEGDLRLVAAAYNAGEGAVERYLGVPPYAETRLYVLKIRAGVAGQTHHPFDPTAADPSPVLPLIRGALNAIAPQGPVFKR